MDRIDMLYSAISYVLIGISLTILSKTSVYYVNKWLAWVPFANHYLFCKIISDKNELELERKLLVGYGAAFGSLILMLLASGSVLASLLMICFCISIVALSVIQLTATYYLINNIIPYAKSIIILCIICSIASYFFKFLELIPPIIVIICSVITLYHDGHDENLMKEREINEKKYGEELEKEKY